MKLPRKLATTRLKLSLARAQQRTLRLVRNTPDQVKQLRRDFGLRRSPSGFQFVIADFIEGLNPQHWDQLVAGHSSCLSRRFLHALASAGPENLTGHYVLIYRHHKPVAALACQSVSINAAALPAESTPHSRFNLRHHSLRHLKQRVLVCGNLLGWGPQGVAFAPDENPAELWPAVAEALYRIRRADKLFGQTGLVMIKDLTDHHHEAAGVMSSYRYQVFATEPNMVLPIKPSWRSFEDYLADLKSSYRSAIRKNMREIEEAGLLVKRLNLAELEHYQTAIFALYLQVHEKQKMRLITISPNWILTLAQQFGDDFACSVIVNPQNDQLLGFITTLKDDVGAIAYYVGFDKTHAEQGLPLYLRLLYAVIEDAILMGAQWTSLGRTALQPKATLGAQPQAIHCLVRHRIPAVNMLVKALLHIAPDPEQAPERTPFKPQ